MLIDVFNEAYFVIAKTAKIPYTIDITEVSCVWLYGFKSLFNLYVTQENILEVCKWGIRC